jgi:hypothetical protein
LHTRSDQTAPLTPRIATPGAQIRSLVAWTTVLRRLVTPGPHCALALSAPVATTGAGGARTGRPVEQWRLPVTCLNGTLDDRDEVVGRFGERDGDWLQGTAPRRPESGSEAHNPGRGAFLRERFDP